MRTDARIFVLAGEPSGDRIGADLVRRLRAKRGIELVGVGGAALAGEGLRSLYPMSDLSVMGFADVVKRLPLLLWRARQTVSAILAVRPDIVVLIDAQVFSATIARRLRKRGYQGPIVLYVAPAVWAWKPERAAELAPLFDEILSVLPFEPEVMQRLGGPPTSYVGHPAVAALPFRAELPERGPVLLLPGSRVGEIGRTLPMLGEMARQLGEHPRVSGCVLPTLRSRQAELERAVAGWPVPVQVVSSDEQRIAAFRQAIAAVAVSGTVTLELALAGVPMVMTYVGDAGQMKRFVRYKVRFAGLPNVVLNRDVVPEIIFTTPDAPRLTAALRQLLDTEGALPAQHTAFAELRALMERGTSSAPIADAADRIIARLPASS